MKVTEAQARRAIGRAKFKWDAALEDGRDAKNQKHAHHGILGLLAVAFACLRVTFRRAEDFSADIGAAARRRLGISKRVSDSTLYRTVAKQKPAGMRETVRNQVRSLLESKVVKHDRFRLKVVSFDGKALWSSTSYTVEGAKMTVDEKNEVVTASLMSLRAVLTSSLVAPCLDVEVIGDKEGEAPAFRQLFPRVVENFGDHFDIVTADAGLTCRENALVVKGAKKQYVFALKENQPKLYAVATQLFAADEARPACRTEEHRNGVRTVRELRVLNVSSVEELNVFGLQQLWRVHQQSWVGDRMKEEEVRIFLSSVPAEALSAREQLDLVRLHWAIENAHNWTMDMALLEDDVQPCQQSRDAIEVVGWLRVLGYNLLAAWRAKTPKKDRRLESWARCAELLRDAFVFSDDEALRATLA